MKFIHTADIHLDSPLTGLSAYPDAPVELLRTATRDAFANLVNEAIEQQVDFMVIAGDLYDGTWKDHNTGVFFCKQMGLLKRAGIPVFLLFGNHDAESEMTKRLQLPDNVKTFGSRRAETFLIEHLNVALHGQSFRDRDTTQNLVTGYPVPLQGMLNIGVLHTALEGNAAHATYAPCSVDELHAKGYDYWALGHVHEHQIWRGASTIVFPGNLQGRHVREQGARGAVVVSADESGVLDVERIFVDVLRWCALEVDASACENLADVAQLIGLALEGVTNDVSSTKPAAVRVTVTGSTRAHGELFGFERQLRNEVIASAAVLGSDRIWIEKVKVATSPPVDVQQAGDTADALADLEGLFMAAETDAEFLAALRTELLVMVTKAPPELQNSVPSFQSIREGHLAGLVQEVRPGLIAHLGTSGTSGPSGQSGAIHP